MKNLNSCFLTPSLKCGEYFTLTAHISLDQPHFKGSIATCKPWLLLWTVKAKLLNSPLHNVKLGMFGVYPFPVHACLSPFIPPHSVHWMPTLCLCLLMWNQKRNGICHGQVSYITGQWASHLWGPAICLFIRVLKLGLPAICGWQMLWIWPCEFSSVF